MATFQSFPVEQSSVDIQSPGFEQARSKWTDILQDFQELLKELSSEGTGAACSKHVARGQLLLRLVDDSRLLQFKPNYGQNMITARAHILGFPVGIVANQRPIIHVQEALKATQFIKTCNQELTPIVFLHNVTGFMVGTNAEHVGIIKAGAQLVSAVSCSQVPHISIIIGSSYGAGNYAMAGRSYKPRFLFSWPTGRCSVMEAIQQGKAKISAGGCESTDNSKARAQELRDQAMKDAKCYSTSAVLIDDGVIDLRDTRDVLGMCLEVVKLPAVEDTESHRQLARI